MHHRDLVGQRQRLGLVVGDIDEGDAGAALQLASARRACARAAWRRGWTAARRAAGFPARPRGCARARRAAAGRRTARSDSALPGPVRLTSASASSTLLLRLGGRHLAQLQAEHDVLEHGLVRPHRVVLEHHAHAALLRRHHAAGRRQQPAVDLDGAGVRHDIAGDQRSVVVLPQPRRAEQRDELVVLDLEIEIGDRRAARRRRR